MFERFVWDDFVELSAIGDEEGGTSLDERITSSQWYARRLEKIGQGMSRSVYSLDSKKVLKIALDKNGIEQNRTEIELSSRMRNLSIAKIYDYDDDRMWIVAEKIDTFKDEEQFEKETGWREDDLLTVLEKIEKENDGGQRVDLRGLDEFAIESAKIISIGRLSPIDVANYSHWGKNRSGELKLVDYGYTSEMYDSLPNFAKSRAI